MPRIIKRQLGLEKTLAYEQYAMTQQEVADQLGISRPQVGVIESRARAKVQKLLKERGLNFNDLVWR